MNKLIRMIPKLILPLSLLFSLSGCYLFTASKSYYGIDTQGKNVFFLIDISGSMEGKSEGNLTDKMMGTAVRKGSSMIRSKVGGFLGDFIGNTIEGESTKLGSAKRELIPAIRGLSSPGKFTVATFSDDVKFWNQSPVEATEVEKDKAIAYTKTLSANGGTSALKGLRAAFQVPGINMIFFLSDGYPSDASTDAILKEVRILNSQKKIVINSIGLGDDKDENFLRTLAQENGGTYVNK